MKSIKGMGKKLLVLVALLALCAFSASAQIKGALVIQCSVSGAAVFADGRILGQATPNFSMMLPAKTYAIKVVKAGYQDFVQNINLTSAGLTIQVNLVPVGQNPLPPTQPTQPSQYSLSISANVANADVIINGQSMGKAPYSASVQPGYYTIVVRASGYTDYSQSVTVNGATQINANLQPLASTLSISSNVPGADILINGNLVGKTPFQAQLVPGTYNVTVRAQGYTDYSQQLSVNGNSSINATLSPTMASLSIGSNVPGADVLLNGTIVGRTPFSSQVAPGTYNLIVRASGYSDYNQTLLVNGPSQINAVLVPQNYQLSVDSGTVRGAEVYLNGSKIGQTPFSGLLPQGNYSLVVRAPGYSDFSLSLSMQGPQTISALLIPQMASWQVNIADKNSNKDSKNGYWNEVFIFIDGSAQRGNSGQILPGRHIIKIVSGGMIGEISFDAAAGRSYTFEPSIGITVK